MGTQIMHIAIDVDDKYFTGAGLSTESGEVLAFKCRANNQQLIAKLKKIEQDGYKLQVCYESTYLGFSLARLLIDAGFNCEVIAASLIPELAGNHKKTDRLDAEKLVQYYSKRLLTVVHIPDKHDEIVRQHIRLRKSLKEQIKSMKHKLKSESKIFGVELPALLKWNSSARDTLYKAINKIEDIGIRDLFFMYIDYIDSQYDHLNKIEATIEGFSKELRYKPVHDALVCLRGIKTLTAMTIIAEVGDINRFSHPRKLASYIGLDIIEYSSGGKERKYGITKAGNERLRTCIIETQQLTLKTPSVGKQVLKRRVGADPKVVAIAKRCDTRLYKRSKHLMLRSKHTNVVKVACAREFIGFLWETMKYVRVNQSLAM